MAKIDLNEVMPIVVLWIPWLMAVGSLRSHFREGRMTAYKRSFPEDSADESASYSTTLSDHPISYRLLFVFYAFVAVAVPVATVLLLWRRVSS